MLKSLIQTRQTKDKIMTSDKFSKILRLTVELKKKPNYTTARRIESDILARRVLSEQV